MSQSIAQTIADLYSGAFSESDPGPCSDPYFTDYAKIGLVWLPSIGMGWLRTVRDPADVYDADYFAKYAGYAATEQGRQITNARIQLLALNMAPGCRLIDVGIGSGDFIEALDCTAWGYDINPAAIAWLERHGLFADPYETEVDALTFWDSLEHIPDVHRMVANARRWVFCSLPIVPGDGPPAASWKHYRADEHCWYFTRAGLVRWFAAQGFECVECNAMESLLGRQDIESFAFRRRDGSL